MCYIFSKSINILYEKHIQPVTKFIELKNPDFNESLCV